MERAPEPGTIAHLAAVAGKPGIALKSFADAINRDLNPQMQSPAVQFITDVVGAADVAAGKAPTASGVVVKNASTLQITLAQPNLPRVEVAASGPSRGPENAPVTIVEFSDFQCPYCGREYPVVERVMKEYDGKVRLVFRHFPLEFHPFAQKAAEAGACAADQGGEKFWKLHDRMFTNQQKLAVDDLKGYAKELGLDSSRFEKCLDSGEKRALVEADEKAGQEAGVSGTPAFFVNGVFINGAVPYEQFKDAVDRELKRKG